MAEAESATSQQAGSDLVAGANAALKEIGGMISDLAEPPVSAEAGVDPDDWDQLDWVDAGFDVLKVSRRLILLRDKVSFVMGNLMVWTIAYWLGWQPETFYQLYTVQIVLLGVTRWVFYRLRNQHYYLLDLCYVVNLLLLVYLWVLPGALPLWHVCYALSTGPLLWSIVAFRNSLVYHDLDKVTSVYMHLVPALVVWTLHWHHDPGGRFGSAGDTLEQVQLPWRRATFPQLALLPLLPHACWALAYYGIVFRVRKDKIARKGYATLFQYILGLKKGVFHAIARRVPQQRRPQVYLLLHAVFTFVTCSIGALCYHSMALHTCLVAALATVSVFNGASWYFDVFVRKYEHRLDDKSLAGKETGAKRE